MSKLGVVNAAMAHLGEPRFTTIETDPPGATLEKVLGQLDGEAGVELQALSRHPWLLALTYATLTPMADPPANWKWTKAFQLPDTFVKLWEVDGVNVAYEVGTIVVEEEIRKVILSHESSLRVSYTEAKGFEAYGPDLCRYMGMLLASRTAGPLKNDYALADRLEKKAEQYALEALSGEAGQHGGEDPRFSSGLSELRRLIP